MSFPALCEVTVDCRLLPEQQPADAEPLIRAALGEGDYELEWDEAVGGTRSAIDTPLWDALASFTAEIEPGARLAPFACPGFTDSHFLREAYGTTAYGYFPAKAMETELDRQARPLRERAGRGRRSRARRPDAAPRRAVAARLALSSRYAVDLISATDERLGDEVGREETVIDDPRRFGETRRELRGIVHRPEPVREDAAVRRRRSVTQLRRADPRERCLDSEREQLERDRRSHPLDELVRRHDHDEAVRRRGDDPLARVRSAVSLDDPAVGGELVGAVDREVEPPRCALALERDDVEA